MTKVRMVVLLLAVLPFNSFAENTWRVTFSDTRPAEAIQLLADLFQMTPVNPGASCLQNNINFDSPATWRQSEAKELISQVVELAGCEAVIYEGDQFIVQDAIVGA